MRNYSHFVMKSIAVFLCLILLPAASVSAKSKSSYVSSASALQKALDDGDITQITIGSSIVGNFVIPRWIESISGSNPSVTITPDKSDKPVFDAESSTGKNAARVAEFLLAWPAVLVHAAVSPWTADTLTISNLTIEIYGNSSVGIDVSSLSKPVYINNVKFVGKGYNALAYRSGSNTNVRNCSFENVRR